MTHFVANFKFRLMFVASFFIIGFLAEAISKIYRSENKNGLILNCLNGLLYHACDVSIGGMTAVGMVTLAHKLWFHGLIAIPAGKPLLASMGLSFLAIAVADFMYYWLHRLQHFSKWLWVQHEVHHSDEHMNVTTGVRFHWTEAVLQPAFIMLPIIVLFNPPSGTAVSIFLFSKAMVYFVHLNARIRFGWFNRILSSPQSHRIHHSKLPEHIDKNFATILPLWDVLFGTYYHPANEEWPSTGVEGVRISTIWQAAIAPFASWRKMLIESIGILRQNRIADLPLIHRNGFHEIDIAVVKDDACPIGSHPGSGRLS